MMRAMVAQARAGCRPEAVSADSITASAPSKTALATSLASARVGRGAVTIDCSISVATIAGVCLWRQTSSTCFWTAGTASGDSSTPRSPRASISASERSAIASMCSTADGVSILGMRPGLFSAFSHRARS